MSRPRKGFAAGGRATHDEEFRWVSILATGPMIGSGRRIV